ncbi:hypothetical protein ES703_117508 [subsurface metagenome]
MILLVGIITGSFVGADEEYIGVISNTTGIDISNFIAGSTTTAEFSFDYEDSYEADKHYPLIFKINISYSGSEEDCQLEDCSVWKNDFNINGFVRRYYLFGLYHKDIKLECSEESPLTINHQMGSNTVDVSNGIFYCYNTTEGTIDDLKKRNKVSLNIFSNPALYPATYKITAQMFYADDTKAPIVNITNKNYFETTYFRELSNIEITATINENVEVSDYWGTIFTDPSTSINDKHQEGDTYYLSKILPIDISEGNYSLKVFAEDTNGNVGNDSTTLRIDRTPPEIELVDLSYYQDGNKTIPIKLNVTDSKSGVDSSSVQYRIREIINGSICPESGVGVGYTCYNSGWLNITYNHSSGLYEDNFNATNKNLNGIFWFEAHAKDVLGNEGEL